MQQCQLIVCVCVCACMYMRMCKYMDVDVCRWINETAVSDNAGIFHGNDFCIGACTRFPLQMIRFHLDIDYAEVEETIKKKMMNDYRIWKKKKKKTNRRRRRK